MIEKINFRGMKTRIRIVDENEIIDENTIKRWFRDDGEFYTEWDDCMDSSLGKKAKEFPSFQFAEVLNQGLRN